MLAVENGLTHLNVDKEMLKRDPTLVSLTLESALTETHWAKAKSPQAIFQDEFGRWGGRRGGCALIETTSTPHKHKTQNNNTT